MTLISVAMSGKTAISPDDTDLVFSDRCSDRGWDYLTSLMRGDTPAPDWLLAVFRNGPTPQNLIVGQEYQREGASTTFMLVSMQWSPSPLLSDSRTYLREPVRMTAELVEIQR